MEIETQNVIIMNKQIELKADLSEFQFYIYINPYK